MSRPSRYLLDKVECFKKIVDFFLGADNEKKAIFLSQIEFWDWEIDNLIYSFVTFEERAKVWEEGNSLDDVLRAKGFILRHNKDLDIRGQRSFGLKYRQEVTAPWKELEQVVQQWNHLLDVCQDNLLMDEKKLEQYGVNKTSVQKFKKTVNHE
jgi:hypothetical protein